MNISFVYLCILLREICMSPYPQMLHTLMKCANSPIETTHLSVFWFHGRSPGAGSVKQEALPKFNGISTFFLIKRKTLNMFYFHLSEDGKNMHTVGLI